MQNRKHELKTNKNVNLILLTSAYFYASHYLQQNRQWVGFPNVSEVISKDPLVTSPRSCSRPQTESSLSISWYFTNSMHICKLRFQSKTESRVFTPSLYNKCVNVRMYIVFPFQEGMKNVSMDKGFMHQFWENLSSGF